MLRTVRRNPTAPPNAGAVGGRAYKRTSAASYPALAVWHRRGSRVCDNLWRAACWEAAAVEALRHGDRSRECHCQVMAIGTLLFGWSVGDSQSEKTSRANVTLSREWQQRYVKRLRELSGELGI